MALSHLLRAVTLLRSYNSGIINRKAFSRLHEQLQELYQQINAGWKVDIDEASSPRKTQIAAAEAEASIALGLVASHLERADHELDTFFAAIKKIERLSRE